MVQFCVMVMSVAAFANPSLDTPSRDAQMELALGIQNHYLTSSPQEGRPEQRKSLCEKAREAVKNKPTEVGCVAAYELGEPKNIRPDSDCRCESSTPGSLWCVFGVNWECDYSGN